MLLIPILTVLSGVAEAAPAGAPRREIPPSVLLELDQLETRFERALAADCDASLCFPKGCAYVDHAVADQPRAGSMPGLGEEAGPGSVAAQTYLTQARCSFAHEPKVSAAAAEALVQRLEGRLSYGWITTTVEHEPLPTLPAAIKPRDAAEEAAEAEPAPEPEPEPEPAPVAAPAAPSPLTGDVAVRELWDALLPHLYWMIGLGLATTSATALFWAWRRVGRASIEEQALLAQLTQPEAAPVATVVEAPSEGLNEAERAFVAEQDAAWRARLGAMDPAQPDPVIEALVRERLRAGDLPLLARAVHQYGDRFLAAFPRDGETATAKLELAALIQTADRAALPGDVAFFEALKKHALAASLASQDDARMVRSLHEDFGTVGLVELIGALPSRLGALLFALSPPVEQHEVARLIDPAHAAALCESLLRSNRMDAVEADALFAELRAARGEGARSAAERATRGITDRGATFDAAGALSLLLPRLSPDTRAALFASLTARFNGALPAWCRDVLVPETIGALPADARADLFLATEPAPLAAYLASIDSADRDALLVGLPESLRATIRAESAFSSRAWQLSLAGQGRRALARGLPRDRAVAGWGGGAADTERYA